MTWFSQTFPDEIAKLRVLYSEPHRAYHTWEHVEALLGHFGQLDWFDPKGVEIAVYYHDAIYDPLSSSNEADSADLMVGMGDSDDPGATTNRSLYVPGTDRPLSVTANFSHVPAVASQML